jgi:hypothetical protein
MAVLGSVYVRVLGLDEYKGMGNTQFLDILAKSGITDHNAMDL